MPRLPPCLMLDAARRNRYLPALLTECRDLPSAQNELRWLTAHADRIAKSRLEHNACRSRPQLARLLASFVRRRSRGEPLQYIVGDQPFGDLEIICRRHVLIPRPETEDYTTSLAACLRSIRSSNTIPQARGLRILDLCTGTGCIALLLHCLLRSSNIHEPENARQSADLQIAGLDISPRAIELAKQNKAHNIRRGHLSTDADQDVTFEIADVLELLRPGPGDVTFGVVPTDSEIPHATSTRLQSVVRQPRWSRDGSWDVVISNPPYISESGYAIGGTTTKSVRNFEPKLALVPPKDSKDAADGGDIFYHHIIRIALQAKATLIAVEVGDSKQACRVAALAHDLLSQDGSEYRLEVWRDDGTVRTGDFNDTVRARTWHDPSDVPHRLVVVWRQDWAQWREENSSHSHSNG